MKRPFILGLAGGIGAGKSTIAALLAQQGAFVSDSDRHAREALKSPEVVERLRSWWGDQIIRPDGFIDRAALARIVFADPAQRTRLEQLVHPLIHALREAELARESAKGTPVFVIDAPLLYEAGLDRQCDAVLFVEVPRTDRLGRVKSSRGWTDEELRSREAAQWPNERKKSLSAYTIENTGPRNAVEDRVRTFYQTLIKR